MTWKAKIGHFYLAGYRTFELGLDSHNSLLKSGRIEESLKEHSALMDALLARDAELSQQRMLKHFKNGLEAAD